MPIKEDAFGASSGETPAAEEPKPKARRRNRKQMIADAVVPGNDEQVSVIFEATGTEGERPWLVAVELFREGKVKFKPDNLKYAVMKMDEQKTGDGAPSADEVAAAGAEAPNGDGPAVEVDGLRLRYDSLQEELDDTGKSETEKIEMLSQELQQVREQIIALGGSDPAGDADTGVHSGEKASLSKNVPPDAEIGDEVVLGAETYRVGHGRVLMQGPISEADDSSKLVQAKNRWQRELGTGSDGPWEKTALAQKQNTSAETTVAQLASGGDAVGTDPETGDPEVEREVVDQVVERVSENVWKIGTGILEKIGLPDYSSLQIGPNSMSRMVVDDGRRTKVQIPGAAAREVSIPTVVIERFGELADTVEYVTRLQRSQLIAFLEAVKPGSTQPQS